MGERSGRTILAYAVAVALSLILFINFSQHAYVFALGLALGAYLADIATFKDGAIFGAAAAVPLALYWGYLGLMPADSNEFAVLVNTLLLTAGGGLYCGLIVWLIGRARAGRSA